MAVSQEQKVDFLLKKLGFTKTKTGLAVDSTLTGTKKAGFAEAIPSPLIIANSSVWNEADSIPATPPVSDTNQVRVYLAATSGHRMAVDSTVANNRAFIAFSTYNNSSSTRLNNWIDTQFGAGYLIKVFRGDPNSGGVQLSAAGSGNNDGWFFDYSAGVLNFNDTNVPSGVQTDNIYIVGYRYIGQTGAPTSGISTFSFLDLTVERNLDVGSQGGISTFRNDIDLNADLDVDGHTNLDNVSVAGVTTFNNLVKINKSGTSELTSIYNNNAATLAINDTGAGAQIVLRGQSPKLIFDQTAGGNGSVYYDSGDLIFYKGVPVGNPSNVEVVRFNQSGVSVSGIVTATGADINGDLDVDGHTNLDNLSVAGVSTFASNVSIGGSTTANGLIQARGGVNNGIKVGSNLHIIDDVNVRFKHLSNASIYLNAVNHELRNQNNDRFLVAGSAVGNGVGLYHFNGSSSTEKFRVNSSGVTVYGTAVATGADINGDLDVDGHTNLDNVNIAGVTTATGNIHAEANIGIGVASPSNRLDIAGTGNQQIQIVRNDGGNGLLFKAGSSHGSIFTVGGHHYFRLLTNNVDRLQINNSGVTTLTGNVFALKDFDVDGHTNLDNVNIAGFTTITQDLNVDGHTNLDNVNISGMTTMSGNLEVGRVTASGYIRTTSQLQIFSTHPTIVLADTDSENDFNIRNDHGTFTVQDADSSIDRFKIASNGQVTITGDLDVTRHLDVDGHTDLDNVSIAGVTTTSGLLDINSGGQANTFKVEDLTSGRVVLAGTGGELEDSNNLTFDGTTLALTGNANFTGNLTVGGVLTYEDVKNVDSVGIVTARAGIFLPDNQKAQFGNAAGSADLEIYHDGANSYIEEQGTGSLFIKGGTLRIQADDTRLINAAGNSVIQVNGNSAELRFNGSRKLYTSNTGVIVNEDLDVDGHTNLDNVSIAGVTTTAGNVDINAQLDVSGQASLSGFTTTTSYGLTTRDLYTTGITTVFKSFRVEGIGSNNDGMMPFVVKHGGYQGIQTSLFTTTLNNYPELVLENTWGGNWNTTGPWKLKWTSPNEGDAGPAGDGRTLAELMPAVGNAGNLGGFRLRTTDGSTGLKEVFSLNSYTSRFYINNSNGRTEALRLDGVGVGITNYIYHYGNNPNDTNTRFGFASNGIIQFDVDGTERFRLQPNLVRFSNLSVGVDINADLDVDGHTNLDNVSVAGIITAQAGIDVTGGVIEAQAGENKIPSLYAAMGNLPSAGSYHGMFAHVHATGRGYFAHAGNWLELVNREINGVVGTGTETYNIGNLVSTSSTTTSLNVTGVTTAVTLDVNGDLDVDGHTELDRMRVTGVATFTNFIEAGSVGSGGIKVGSNLFIQDQANVMIQNTGNGSMYLKSRGLVIRDRSNNNLASFSETGGTNLYHHSGSTKKLGTTATGINILEDLDVDGHTNLDNVSIAGVTTAVGTLRVGTGHTFHNNGNAQIAGIATVYNQLNIPRYYGSAVPTGQYLSIGTDEMVMYQRWNGSVSTIEFRNHSAFFGHTSNAHGKTLTIQGGSYTRFKYIQSNGGSGTYVLFDKMSGGTGADGFVQLYGSYNNKVLSTHTNLVKILKDIDVDGHTELDNANISGIVTAAQIRLPSAQTSNSNLSRFYIGDAAVAPMQIYYDGNNNHSNILIQNSTGGLNIRGEAIRIRDIYNGTTSAEFNPGSDVQLRFNNSLKFATTNTGINVTGNTVADGLVIDGDSDLNGDLDVDGHTNLDNVSIAGVTTFATTAEFNGTAKFNTSITANGTTGNNGEYLMSTGSGLDWGSFPSLRTKNTFTASSGQTTFNFAYTVGFLDVYVNGIKLADSEFTATNGTSTVLAVGCFVGDIVELVAYNTVSNYGGAFGLGNIVEDLTPQLGGDLDLFNKSITGTGNVNITGIITATQFKGDGSGLTGIVASGSGVVIKNGGTTVGTAGTINFGTNLSVSPISSGIVTITATGGGSGISTISGVVNIANDLDVDGHTNLDNVNVAGVTTFANTVNVSTINATTFAGNGDFVDIDVDGHTNLDNVSVAGVSTFTGAINVASDIRSNSLILKNAAGGQTYATFSNGGAATLNWNNTPKLSTSNTGITVTGTVAATSYTGDGSQLTGIGAGSTTNTRTNTLEVVGVSTFNGNIDANGDLDVDGHTNLDNVSVAGVTTTGGLLDINAGGQANTFKVEDLTDGRVVLAGSGGELQDHGGLLYSSGSSTLTSGNQNITGNLNIDSSGNLSSPNADIDDFISVGSNIHLGNAGIITATAFVGDGSNLTNLPGGGSYGNTDVNNHLNVSSASSGQILSWNGSDYAWVNDQTGGGTDVGITTNLSGTFTASAGTPSTINTFGYGSGDLVVEYTIYIKNGSDFQTQKLLAMRDGTTIHSTQFAVMFSSSLLVQCDATISSGNILLRATPESGISGSTTYKIKREVM